MPERVRLSRAKGWRKPENAVVVSRPTRWGNPYRTGDTLESRAEAVGRYEQDLHAGRLRVTVEDVRSQLAGHDLACWCSLDGPCHADVLLRIANSPADSA
jgi:Domain of unknown function (DUF4326)